MPAGQGCLLGGGKAEIVVDAVGKYLNIIIIII